MREEKWSPWLVHSQRLAPESLQVAIAHRHITALSRPNGLVTVQCVFLRGTMEHLEGFWKTGDSGRWIPAGSHPGRHAPESRLEASEFLLRVFRRR